MPPDATPDDEPDPLERLTDEFLQRHRSGEHVEIEAFAAEHPDHADQLRHLVPMLVQLEAARPAEPLRVHEQLGRWRVLRELGRGGMGIVYLGVDDATGEQAALKLTVADHPETRARFRREAEAIARVQHPGMCRVLEVAPAGGALWVALEYIEGETIADLLRRERREGEPTPSPSALASRDADRWLAAGQQVALALHAAHEVGLVHRDIKPANVMLTRTGRAVVLDFGLVRDDGTGEQTRLTHTGVPIGTPTYMSPEQVRAGTAPIDRRTDVYSLGATLYEALTLTPPFQGPTIASLFSQILASDAEPARRRNPALSRDVEVVLATALEKRPERRYATARHFAEDLDRARRGLRVRARPAGPLRRLGAWAVRHPALAAGVGSIGLALVTGLVVALLLLARVGAARDGEAAAGRRARSRALASASLAAGPDDAMLALLLAREAVRAGRSPETITQLHAAVHDSLERERLEGHEGAVTSIAWDGRGEHVATGCADGRARLFARDGTLRLVIPPLGEPAAGGIQVALSPSGTRLATWTPTGDATLWDASGNARELLATALEPAREVFFLVDGTVVVVAQDRLALHGPDGGLRRSWDVEARGEESAVLGAVAAWDAAHLHVLTDDLRTTVHDAHGVPLREGEPPAGAAAAQLLDGGWLAWLERHRAAVGPADAGADTVHMLTPDGRPAGSLGGNFPVGTAMCATPAWWCAWSPVGTAVLARAEGQGVRLALLDMQYGEPPALAVATRDGGRLFTARAFSTIAAPRSFATPALRLWSSQAAPLASMTSAHDMVTRAAFSPDGSRLVLGGHAPGAATSHATAPSELASAVPNWSGRGYRYSVGLTAAGDHMVTFADELHLGVVRDDGSVRSTFAYEPAPSQYISVLPESGLILLTSGTGAVVVYDLDGRQRLLVPPEAGVHEAFWIGEDGAFVTGSRQRRVRFHDPAGAVVAEHEGALLPAEPQRGHVHEVALQIPGAVQVRAADGTLRREIALAAGEQAVWYHGSAVGRSVLLVETSPAVSACRYVDEQGNVLWEERAGGFGHQSVAISRDGARVAFLASGGLRLCDDGGREVARLRIEGGVAALAFDAAGERLVAATAAGVVRVWDRDGRILFDLPNQGGRCYVAFSRDGRRLGTVSASMARLFTTDVDELEALAARRSTRGFSDSERARYGDLLGSGR